MSVENLNIDISKMDFTSKNTDFTQKSYSKDTNNFSNVFESANKSYNFSFEKNEKFSAKTVNQYGENKNFKDFKSDYENFHSKIKEKNENLKTEERNKFSDDKKQVKNEKVADKKPENEIKNKSDNKIDDKKNEKPEQTQEQQKSDNQIKENEVNQQNVVVDENSQNIQDIQAIAGEQNILPQKTDENLPEEKTTAKTEDENAAPKTPQNLSNLQNQIANEKILNKQADNILNKKEAETQDEIPAKNSSVDPKANEKTSEESQKQTNSKPEVIVSQNILEKTEAIAKNQAKLPQNESHQKATEKLAEAMQDETAKPVITNIEVKNGSSSLNQDGQPQKQQLSQEIKTSAPQAQVLASDENNVQKLDTQKISQFEKVMNAKTSQNLENSVMTQLKDKISSDLAANKSEVTIALRPDNLGKVSINLVSQNGVLTAQITAENNQVKDILNKGLESLKQNMAEQGINVGKMVVNVQEPSTANQNNSEQNLKNFENSNNFNANHQSGKQNFSEQSATSGYEKDYQEFEEEADSEENQNRHNAEKQRYNNQTTTIEYTI